MSKIIKGSALRLTDPKIVELSSIGQPDSPVPEQTEKDGQQQLYDLHRESQQVLQETEAMIVDLLEKAREEAHGIIAAARDEAELLHIQALQTAREMEDEARENGYKNGIKQAEEEMAGLREAAEQEKRALLEAARAQKLQMLADSEADILRLVMAITRKVVAAELVSNPDVILNVIREAIALLDHPDNVTIHVNPADLDQVLQEIGNGLHAEADQRLIEADVFPDSRINSGGCTLESEVGMIDARMETRWEIVERTLQEVTCDD